MNSFRTLSCSCVLSYGLNLRTAVLHNHATWSGNLTMCGVCVCVCVPWLASGALLDFPIMWLLLFEMKSARECALPSATAA